MSGPFYGLQSFTSIRWFSISSPPIDGPNNVHPNHLHLIRHCDMSKRLRLKLRRNSQSWRNFPAKRLQWEVLVRSPHDKSYRWNDDFVILSSDEHFSQTPLARLVNPYTSCPVETWLSDHQVFCSCYFSHFK